MRVRAVRLSQSGYRWLTFTEAIPMRLIGQIEKRESTKPDRRSRSVNWHAIRAMNAARRAQAKIPPEDRPALAQEYLETDVTYEEIAGRYGLVSGEWVRQFIIEIDPTIPERKKLRRRRRLRERDERDGWREFWARCQKALDEDRRCVVCGAWVIRDFPRTCSPEHAKAWAVIRDVEDPDARRRAQAKVYLASPEKYPESNLEWARQMLSDNPPPRNRQYLVPGSGRAEIIRKHRPALYRALVEDKETSNV